VAGALLARPGIARAQGRTFTHTYNFGFDLDLPAAEGTGDARLQLHVAADGGAQARGTVHLPVGDPPTVLVATGEAEAVFADDGLAGLTVQFRRPSPPAACRHVAGDIDFDAPVGPSGTYAADVAFVDRDTGETLFAGSLDVVVKAVDGRPPPAAHGRQGRHGQARQAASLRPGRSRSRPAPACGRSGEQGGPPSRPGAGSPTRRGDPGTCSRETGDGGQDGEGGRRGLPPSTCPVSPFVAR
jgi:hypothetical protein